MADGTHWRRRGACGGLAAVGRGRVGESSFCEQKEAKKLYPLARSDRTGGRRGALAVRPLAGMMDGFFLRAGARGGGHEGGKLAGPPKQEELFEAAKDAREDGGDEGIDGRRQPDARLLPGLRSVAQAGDLLAQGG